MATFKEATYVPTPPGISLTDAPKSRAWLSPPKHVKVGDVAQMYIDKLSSEAIINTTLDAIETEAPLSSLAEAIMLSGVAKGLHTIDAGILVMPVIVEMLKTTAELHGVDYSVFGPEEGSNEVHPRLVKAALKQAATKNTPKEIAAEEAPKVELSGLMARKGEA